MSTLCAPTPSAAPATAAADTTPRAASYLVFSGELDRLLMAFTLATTSAAGGLRTSMFFTFWSLSALRQPASSRGKGLIERMFGWLLPRGSASLPLSRLQFLGIGPRLIRWRMRRCQVASLEELIATAQALGVRLIVCETSMQLMGFRRDEMLPGVEYGGASTCVGTAADAAVAMVI
ncbi:MAG: DsrE/DsrF/DrsH-like family protein [Planctomycetes bacterium]|jgi:peroxiredoxin family protein|nr:DsrE/DsrF/DrsH-like family protein [Planctomycetota bacterium]